MLIDILNLRLGDVARSRGACRVIAVDVGAATETNFTNYGDHLSGWWLLWKKWTGRWTGQIKVVPLCCFFHVNKSVSMFTMVYCFNCVTITSLCYPYYSHVIE